MDHQRGQHVTLDPRLRLLGTDTMTTTAQQVLMLLDSTEITIRLGSDAVAACDSAVIAVVALASRLFGHVDVQPARPLSPNWWGISHTDEFAQALEAVRVHSTTPATTHLTVTVGTVSDVAEGGVVFGIGGGDYTLRIARQPQPLDSNVTHGFGLHAAACLAISQLITHTLEPAGCFSGVQLAEPYVMNLIDYSLHPAVDLLPRYAAEAGSLSALALVFAGIGSVGTSALALLCQAIAPALVGSTANDWPVGTITTIDKDTFDASRNPYRYPALLGGENSAKAPWMAERLRMLGLAARSHPGDVASWVQSQDGPGLNGLLVSSVDTLSGRLDVADVLARQTLSIGVDGLALHAQREHVGDGFACPYCDYVTATPPMSQADVHAELTGLSIARVLALSQPGATLTNDDVDAAIAAGKVSPSRREALTGASLSDLIRQAYAEIEMHSGGPHKEGEKFTLAAPQASWFAGVLAAVEIVKELDGLPTVDRRVDVDLLGLPPGLTRRMPADATGRCLCHGRRADWYRMLYPTDYRLVGREEGWRHAIVCTK